MTNDYYQKHKEKLLKLARERYQNLSQEERDKRRKKSQKRYQNFAEKERGKRRYKNLSEEQKQKLVINNKITIERLCRFFKDLGQLNFLFHGLVLEI